VCKRLKNKITNKKSTMGSLANYKKFTIKSPQYKEARGLGGL
jgi:hypothetical protein